jgi:hypothetical protein
MHTFNFAILDSLIPAYVLLFVYDRYMLIYRASKYDQEPSARHTLTNKKDVATCRYKAHTLSQSMTAPLSLQSAHLINSALTFGYVLPLYFTKYTRLSFSRSTENENDQSPSKGASERLRDDPAVIKARMLSVFVSTMASLCLMHRVVVAGQSQEFDVSSPSSHAFVIYMHFSQRGWATTTAHLGFYVRGRDLLACLVTPVLFLGPLYARYLSRNLPFMARWTFNKQVTDIFNWIFIRNYIVVRTSLTILSESSNLAVPIQGPISEEVVWRSCLIVAYRLAGASNTLMVFFTPLSFGSGASLLFQNNDMTSSSSRYQLICTIYGRPTTFIAAPTTKL